MPTTTLSEAAVPMLRLHVEQDNTRIDDPNREAHRDLARAGLMERVHTFALGGFQTPARRMIRADRDGLSADDLRRGRGSMVAAGGMLGV